MFAFVRTAIEPERVVAAVRRQLYSIDPILPVPALGTLDARFARSYALEGQSSGVLLCFAITTLLIAVLGVYATMSRSVNARVKEIGIRRAVGATTTNIATVVSARVARVVSIGWISGMGLSVVLLRTARTFMADVAMPEPVTLLAATGLVIFSGLVACASPVMRAVRVDPATALRSD